MRTPVLIAALALASCGSTGPKPDAVTGVIEKDVPVPVRCIPAATPRAPGAVPSTGDMRALGDAAARHQALADFYLTWAPWIAMAAPLIENCRNAAPAPAAP